jgi:hypothetical protein
MKHATVAACMLLALCSWSGAVVAQSAPPQAWASKSGVVKLQPHGSQLANADLRDRLLVAEAFSRWGVAYDEARLDIVRSLFTSEAVFDVLQGSAEPIAHAVGPDDIVLNVEGSLRQQNDQRRHAITNILVERLTRTEATAVAYGIVTVAADGLKLGATVIYSGDLRKGADGTWRFSRFVIGMDGYAGRRIVNPVK